MEKFAVGIFKGQFLIQNIYVWQVYLLQSEALNISSHLYLQVLSPPELYQQNMNWVPEQDIEESSLNPVGYGNTWNV